MAISVGLTYFNDPFQPTSAFGLLAAQQVQEQVGMPCLGAWPLKWLQGLALLCMQGIELGPKDYVSLESALFVNATWPINATSL